MKGLSSSHMVGRRGSFWCHELPGPGVGAQECSELPAPGGIQTHRLYLGGGSVRWRLSWMTPEYPQRPPCGGLKKEGWIKESDLRDCLCSGLLTFPGPALSLQWQGRPQKETAGNCPLPHTEVRKISEHGACGRVYAGVRARVWVPAYMCSHLRMCVPMSVPCVCIGRRVRAGACVYTQCLACMCAFMRPQACLAV